MELEYKLADLIGKANCHEEWTHALSAFENTAYKLDAEQKERINKLLNERGDYITTKRKEFYDMCFTIRKEHGFQNVIKPLPSEDVTAANVEKAAAGMKYVNDTDAD